MNDNTTKLLEQLAGKLGTTTEYLWEILLRQAPISATIGILQLIATIIFGYVLYRVNKKVWEVYDDNILLGTGMIVLAVLWIVLMIVQFICFEYIIYGFFNPEYWALKEILNSLRPHVH